MNDLVGKLTGCIGDELKEIKKVVKDTDRQTRYDPFQCSTSNNMVISRASILEEP